MGNIIVRAIVPGDLSPEFPPHQNAPRNPRPPAVVQQVRCKLLHSRLAIFYTHLFWHFALRQGRAPAGWATFGGPPITACVPVRLLRIGFKNKPLPRVVFDEIRPAHTSKRVVDHIKSHSGEALRPYLGSPAGSVVQGSGCICRLPGQDKFTLAAPDNPA